MANKYAHYSRQSKTKSDLYRKIHRKGFLICAKKVAFDSPESAQRFVGQRGYEGQPYKCPHCNMWHNTTKA